MNNLSQTYLLTTPLAELLYQNVAKNLPIIDYHNHLSVADIASNRQFENITQLWIASDPYKHRAMRILGIPERLITGDSSDWEKFSTWCEIFPLLLGNPLYDWSCLEMANIFGIKLPICTANARAIWDQANVKLQQPDFSADGLVDHFHAEYLAPCTSIADDLTPFQGRANLAPSLRGDDILNPTPAFLKRLSQISGTEIVDEASYHAAIISRLDAFNAVGCRVADHALDNGFKFARAAKREDYIKALRSGQTPDSEAAEQFFTETLIFAAAQYAKRNWALQLHIGAQRFTNSALRKLVGPAGGFACIGNSVDIQSLAALLDAMVPNNPQGAKVIIYTLNPSDNALIATLSGSFRGVTQGPAWWLCDHLQGMRAMLESFNTYSVLSEFTGMTTDSRSLLSLLRHDYFRRTLCGWIGEKAAKGELPDDFAALKPLVYALAYGNAKKLII